jgi:hypothetical protein
MNWTLSEAGNSLPTTMIESVASLEANDWKVMTTRPSPPR